MLGDVSSYWLAIRSRIFASFSKAEILSFRLICASLVVTVLRAIRPGDPELGVDTIDQAYYWGRWANT